MKRITINGKNLEIKLEDMNEDRYAAWRNGIVTLENGTRIECGGGWIANEEDANAANEEAGIADGMRAGVWYPYETHEGDFIPYEYGEDESGWQNEIMTELYGSEWEDREDSDEEVREVYRKIQNALKTLKTLA